MYFSFQTDVYLILSHHLELHSGHLHHKCHKDPKEELENLTGIQSVCSVCVELNNTNGELLFYSSFTPEHLYNFQKIKV